MARQRLKESKVKKLIEETGLDIDFVLVRGGTNHSKLLCLKDGTVIEQKRTGELRKTIYRC